MRRFAPALLGLVVSLGPSLAWADDPSDAAPESAPTSADDGAAPAPLPHGGPGGTQGGQSFTPESFLLPVDSIVLSSIDPNGGSGWNGGGPLYRCPSAARADLPPTGDAGSPDAGASQGGDAGSDCYVDMADDAALAALFAQGASVPAGTYNAIVMNNCDHEGSFVAKVKGTVVLDGTTYYTTAAPAGASALSASPADYGYVSIRYAGCSGALRLAESVTVHDGDSLTVSAFFTLRDVAWVLPDFSPGLGGCADGPAHARNVCSGLPTLVSYVGTSAPALSTFLITEDPSDHAAAKAGGEVLLLSQGGAPFSGFLRRFYSPTSVVPSVSYDVPLRSVRPAGSATYTLTSFGDPAEDPSKFRVQFPSFEMATHAGTMRTADGASSVSYVAVER